MFVLTCLQMVFRWAKIASFLPGRTDNEIKNVWHTHLKKRLARKESSPSSSNCKISCVNDGNIKVEGDGEQANFGSSENLQKSNSFEVECSQDSTNLMTEIFMELDRCNMPIGHDPSVDDSREFSSISPSEPDRTSSDFQAPHDDDKDNQDFLIQVPEFSLDPEVWSMVDDDSCFLTPRMVAVVEDGAHNNAATSIGDSAGEVDNSQQGTVGLLGEGE